MSHPRLTPDEVRDLIEQHGTMLKAARATGIPRSNLRNWLDPEAHRARERAYYAANPEPKRARNRRHWGNLSGLAYSRRLLQMRRVHGLHRMAERKRRQEAI